MNEEQADELEDAFLDVDDLDDVVLDGDPDDQEGLTDGSETTDETELDVDVLEVDEAEEDALPDEEVLSDADDSGFVPVNYEYDADGTFINLDATDDDVTIIDVEDEDPYV